MTTFDWIMAAVFVATLTYGVARGIVTQAGSLASMAMALAACWLCGDCLTRFGTPIFLSYLLVFLAVYLVMHFVTKVVRRFTHAINLGLIDRILGGMFATLKGFLALSLLLNAWLALNPSANMPESKLLGGEASHIVVSLAPDLWGWTSTQTAQWLRGETDNETQQPENGES